MLRYEIVLQRNTQGYELPFEIIHETHFFDVKVEVTSDVVQHSKLHVWKFGENVVENGEQIILPRDVCGQ